MAAHFKRRIREPARFDAFMACRSAFISDTPCARCGSQKRTVYTASCWQCQITRRPLRLDAHGAVLAWPPAQRTRESFLDVHARKRRAKAGECVEFNAGDVLARKYPDGRLFIERTERAPRFHIEDANRLPPAGAAWLLDQMKSDPNLRAVAAWDNW
ncbi:MAG: hypothetical protein EPN34_06120 [Burkholderiaceae bacterium]|nr:MAG: hypothetical protein EPN34_06120 [Burkholderiaceae bacterium]